MAIKPTNHERMYIGTLPVESTFTLIPFYYAGTNAVISWLKRKNLKNFKNMGQNYITFIRLQLTQVR